MMTILELCVPITNRDGDDPQTAHHHHQMKKIYNQGHSQVFFFSLNLHMYYRYHTMSTMMAGTVEKDEEQE